MSDPTPPTRVAIACQGGGSHNAFTAGVLKGLFADWDARCEVAGISGTSGGAINALAAWYGLVTGGESRAVELLDAVWSDLAARGPTETLLNQWYVGTKRLESTGIPFPQLSPYQNPVSKLGMTELRRLVERHVDFDETPNLCTRDTPDLVVGAVNINAGTFETFTNHEVTPESILASAAIPEVFEAVEINGEYHWDGLFSQNPPIHELMSVEATRKPNELWVIQINPQVRDRVPETLDEIADRRNELAGNLSLNQQLRSIERVNNWIDEGHLPDDKFTKTRIRRIQMNRSLHWATKYDRSAGFLRDLMEAGEHRAREIIPNPAA